MPLRAFTFNMSSRGVMNPDNNSIPLHPEITNAVYTGYFTSQPIAAGYNLNSTFTETLYDSEVWANTPVAEQQDPVTYITQFATDARNKGLKVAIEPACNLAGGNGQTLVRDILTPTAKLVDIVVLQFEKYEANPFMYFGQTRNAVATLRSLNSQIQIIAELSTAPFRNPTIDNLTQSWLSVGDMVDGLWLNVDHNDVDAGLALQFLHLNFGA